MDVRSDGATDTFGRDVSRTQRSLNLPGPPDKFRSTESTALRLHEDKSITARGFHPGSRREDRLTPQ